MYLSNVFGFLNIFAVEILGLVLFVITDYCYLYSCIYHCFCMLDDVYVYVCTCMYKVLGF